MGDEGVTGLETTRRALFLGASGAGASVLLAACGSDEQSGSAPQGDAGAATSPGNADSGSAALAKTEDIPVGGGKIFAAQSVVVTQPTKGTFKGFSAICTHQGCPVSSVDGGTINCTCHGSKYSIEDGSVKTGPSTRPLDPRAVSVKGDSISLA